MGVSTAKRARTAIILSCCERYTYTVGKQSGRERAAKNVVKKKKKRHGPENHDDKNADHRGHHHVPHLAPTCGPLGCCQTGEKKKREKTIRRRQSRQAVPFISRPNSPSFLFAGEAAVAPFFTFALISSTSSPTTDSLKSRCWTRPKFKMKNDGKRRCTARGRKTKQKTARARHADRCGGDESRRHGTNRSRRLLLHTPCRGCDNIARRSAAKDMCRRRRANAALRPSCCRG